MPGILRIAIPYAVCAIAAFAAGQTIAQDAPACLHGISDDQLRKIALEGGGTLWVGKGPAGVTQCVEIDSCQWQLSDSSTQSFGSLDPFVDLNGPCGSNDGAWHGQVWKDQCDLTGADAGRFAQLRAIQAASVFDGAAECVQRPTRSAAWNGVVEWAGAPALVLQTPVSGDLCLTVALSLSQDLRGAMLSPACATTRDETAAILALPAVTAIPFAAWIGVRIGDDSVAAELDLTSVAAPPAPQVVVSGQLDKSYLTDWLASAVGISWSDTALDEQDDPFPGSSATEPVGRLTKFLAAALLRLAVAPYPEKWEGTWPARDWLARNAMLPDAPAGLFLRGERAVGAVGGSSP